MPSIFHGQFRVCDRALLARLECSALHGLGRSTRRVPLGRRSTPCSTKPWAPEADGGKKETFMATSDGEAHVDLGIVVPAYNEEENLPILIGELAHAFRGSGVHYEVLLVDDGSRDGTADVI